MPAGEKGERVVAEHAPAHGEEDEMGGDGNSAYGHRTFGRSRSHFDDRITADARGRPAVPG